MDNKRKWIASTIEMIVVMALTFVIFKYVVIPVRIDGSSMENTLHDDNIALMNAWSIDEDDIDYFDVVVVYSEELDEKIIKRVIGLPGDTVEFKDDILYINGVEKSQDFLDESFVEKSKRTYNSDVFTHDFKVEVGDDEYFVMGDNRLRSTDSRELGCFQIDDFIGVKGIVIFPFSAIQWLG